MEELMDLLVSDESPSQVSDQIKDILFAKTAEKIDAIRPQVANQVFDEPNLQIDNEYEVEDELEVSSGDEEEYEVEED
jgi:hypothetical protein